MGKNKLRRFAENETFKCLVQSEWGEVFGTEHSLKGRWAADFWHNEQPIVLEVGCGKGEYTIGLARREPDKNFIGIDIKGARLWRGAKTVTEEGLTNAAFLRTRVEVIESFFAPGEVDEIWFTFSDPQLRKPRKRLTAAMFLNRYSRFLKAGGVVHLKTDSVHLYEYTKTLLEANGVVPEIACTDVYATEGLPDEVRAIQTTYERRFLDEGLAITYLKFRMPSKAFEEIEFWGDALEDTLDDRRLRDLKRAKPEPVVVEICEQSGFCFGVVRAIGAAEELLDRERQGAYSLGAIVHNRVEVERLEKRGLRVIAHEDLATLPAQSTVLVRAHGEPPATYDQLKAQGVGLVDATCPVVASLQQRVRRAWEAMQMVGGTVVILGKRGHSEVVGLTGQVAGDAVVVEGVADLEQVDSTRPVVLLSQTTQSLELFERVKNALVERAVDPSMVEIHDTICRQVSNRNPHLSEFSARFDVVVFVSGRDSSNGAVLYEVCRSSNPATYFVERQEELDGQWFEGVRCVGVCGATSTPRWLMERVAKKIKEFVR